MAHEVVQDRVLWQAHRRVVSHFYYTHMYKGVFCGRGF